RSTTIRFPDPTTALRYPEPAHTGGSGWSPISKCDDCDDSISEDCPRSEPPTRPAWTPRRHGSTAGSANCPARCDAWNATTARGPIPSPRYGRNWKNNYGSTLDCKPRPCSPTCNAAGRDALSMVNCGRCRGTSNAGVPFLDRPRRCFSLRSTIPDDCAP